MAIITPEKQIKPINYITEFDSIRAIAVILVLIHHLIPAPWSKYIGPYAVALFFVLSGFLITRILLSEKMKISENATTFGKAIKSFYIRRSIRILPIYYLLFISLFLFHQVIEIDIKGSAWYYLTYTSNILLFNLQRWIGMFSHTWSLSVEEQFYFIWPFFVLLVPFDKLKLISYTIIAGGFLYSLVFPMLYPELKFFNLQTPACMPVFALGALLGYHNFSGLSYNAGFLKICYVIGMIFPVILIVIGYLTVLNPFDYIGQLYYGIPAACFIISALNNKSPLINKFIFSNKFLIYLGKISYGIYLYHMPIYYLWPYLNHRLYRVLQVTNPDIQFTSDIILCSLITYFVSILSWKYIEKPINKLKLHY